MSLKEWIFSGKSQTANNFFKGMLSFINASWRKSINDPEKTVRASGIKKGQTVLEIGCGSGYFTLNAAEMTGNKGCLFSIDLHPISVEETEKKVKKNNLSNVTVLQEDACQTRFKDNFFDLVLLYGVVPGPINIKKLSAEINRVLKPDGHLAVWPFSCKRAFIKSGNFKLSGRLNGVFQYVKI